MRPEDLARDLERRLPGWAILWGKYSHQFVAFPTWPGMLCIKHIAAPSATELERRVQLASTAAGPAHGYRYSRRAFQRSSHPPPHASRTH